ncbi:hypothetical protein O181_077933 [Austropuccinia psidii MF-1]|uniref:Retrotransposon gag domain-containing protein n=1 Tax=Austropuccinia psidii MF-1 TaxID=1389203 RepID=A0A9Q3FDQ9_9BASI|nr:hypothetical protein [Austropuccinia psidii MF-1]
MMEQMTQFVGKLSQAVAPRDNSKAPAYKTPSMKAPDHFDGTQAHKLRVFIQSCKLIFHNDPENFCSDRKKFLYSTSFLTGRACTCIEPSLSNISNEGPSYLLSNWKLFETQLFILFGDPNEFRKFEQELENLRMKESGHVSLYIAYFRSLMSRIGDWGERAYINFYKRGLASRLLDHLASHPGIFYTLQELMDVTLELNTSGIESSTSNAFATSVNSVALVGELNTPSLTPSVHIPSIIFSQSLLASRDEVFKEIKDVGEDVAISSLHLFQGDMDLPPLSFHDSLEEQWDEAEEP